MDDKSYNKIKQNFLSELTKASKSKKSSLSYIRNIFSQKPLIQNGVVQAFVIGGTNYISVITQIKKGQKYKIIKTKKGRLPVFKSRSAFSEFLSKHLHKDLDAVGLNFAFPLEPITNTQKALDGILIRGTKEHTFKGLVGNLVGEFIKQIYFEKYNKIIPVTVANDTICLTLAGSGAENGAMVLGTGFNLSLNTAEKYKKSIANLEAGGFDGFMHTEVLKDLDRKSEEPGKMLFEKAVSGKYLVTYFNKKAKVLKMKIRPLKTTEALSRLAETNKNDEGDLARTLMERSASLIACAIAGIYEFRKHPSKMEFITEGSLFWKGYKYQENVQNRLQALGVPKSTIKFKYVEDSSIKGAMGLLIR